MQDDRVAMNDRQAWWIDAWTVSAWNVPTVIFFFACLQDAGTQTDFVPILQDLQTLLKEFAISIIAWLEV